MQPWELYFAGRCEAGQMTYGWAIIRTDTGEEVSGGNPLAPTIDGGSVDIAAYIGLFRALERMAMWLADSQAAASAGNRSLREGVMAVGNSRCRW